MKALKCGNPKCGKHNIPDLMELSSRSFLKVRQIVSKGKHGEQLKEIYRCPYCNELSVYLSKMPKVFSGEILQEADEEEDDENDDS